MLLLVIYFPDGFTHRFCISSCAVSVNLLLGVEVDTLIL
jgi:hypothetical protein